MITQRQGVIVDIDGTLALRDPDDPNGRGPYDWHRVLEDKPNEPVIAAVKAMQLSGYVTLFVSGRKEQCREHTALWLQRQGLIENHLANGGYGEHGRIFAWRLFMRYDNDNRDDSILKKEIYLNEIKPYFNVLFVIDDRQRVVDMWRKHGLTVFQVAKGDF